MSQPDSMLATRNPFQRTEQADREEMVSPQQQAIEALHTQLQDMSSPIRAHPSWQRVGDQVADFRFTMSGLRSQGIEGLVRQVARRHELDVQVQNRQRRWLLWASYRFEVTGRFADIVDFARQIHATLRSQDQ